MATGCATTSFAPPAVNLNKQTTVESARLKSCDAQIVTTNNAIGPNVNGARALIDNFIYVYRCRAHGAANGRQAFEIPQLLLAAGGAIAAAYGAGPDIAIGTGGAGAILANGKSYYNPMQKAAIYDHALDALLCIKIESVGLSAFDAGSLRFSSSNEDGTSVTVPAGHRYFDMVSAALFSVERILSSRLSTSGTYDAAGLLAEIENIKKRVDEAEAAATQRPRNPSSETPAPTPTPSSTTTPTPTPTAAETARMGDERNIDTVEGLQFASGAKAGSTRANQVATQTIGDSTSELFSIKLDVLQPKLQQCVVRAKL